MPSYTVTFFNSDGRVSHVQDIEADDDDAILDAVGESVHRHAIEVHEGARHVGSFAPLRESPPQA